jgi:hypothetical protein
MCTPFMGHVGAPKTPSDQATPGPGDLAGHRVTPTIAAGPLRKGAGAPATGCPPGPCLSSCRTSPADRLGSLLERRLGTFRLNLRAEDRERELGVFQRWQHRYLRDAYCVGRYHAMVRAMDGSSGLAPRQNANTRRQGSAWTTGL